MVLKETILNLLYDLFIAYTVEFFLTITERKTPGKSREGPKQPVNPNPHSHMLFNKQPF